MKAQIVSFHCVLRDPVGKVLSSTFNQGVITEVAGESDLLPALAEGLKGLKTGEKRRIRLTAEQAYGFYVPELVVEYSRKRIPRGEHLRMGDQVQAQLQSGEMRTFRVVGASEHSVTLDGNHPLAGQDLVFEIEATEARDATEQEIAEARFTPSAQNYH